MGMKRYILLLLFLALALSPQFLKAEAKKKVKLPVVDDEFSSKSSSLDESDEDQDVLARGKASPNSTRGGTGEDTGEEGVKSKSGEGTSLTQGKAKSKDDAIEEETDIGEKSAQADLSDIDDEKETEASEATPKSDGSASKTKKISGETKTNVTASQGASSPEINNSTLNGFLFRKATGPDDISPDGNCTADIERFCKNIKAGDAQLSNCISDQVKVDISGNNDKGPQVSEPCKQELRAFKITLYKGATLDKIMEKSCRKEITTHCDDYFLYPDNGNVLDCLRGLKVEEKLSPQCKQEVFRAQQDAALDFRMDPQLNDNCGKEADKFCKDVPPGNGQVQECLRKERRSLSWDCQAELFRQETENADDIRLNVRLFQACQEDKRRYCKDVVPGDARVKDCLEEHRLEPDFSPNCKAEFDKMMARRASDFRLDTHLRKFCGREIYDTCYSEVENMPDVALYDAKVITCLQDYREEIKDPKCRQQVHRLMKRASESIVYDRPLAAACQDDRATTCKSAPDGMAQVFRCLQDNRDKLKEDCKAALFEQEVKMAEDIDFKFPLKQACNEETNRFCSKIAPGHAAIVKCLQEKIKDEEMGESCKKELERDMQRSAEDYRLNYRLEKACDSDPVEQACVKLCGSKLDEGATCGGVVLKCLTEKIEEIKLSKCKKEVFSFARMEVSDVRLDVPLQVACQGAIDTVCKYVGDDHSRLLSCLRNHRKELTKECKAEEMRFSIMEASDIRLTPTVMNACGMELQGFCSDVPPTNGEAFKCLQSKLEEIGIGAACKAEINLQAARHASNYRLDVRVSKQCRADIETVGCNVDEGNEGQALVLKCMVAQFKRLSASCQTEVSYAVRMALWQYNFNASLTSPCDGDVDSFCKSEDVKPLGETVIGVYGQCLVSTKRSKLSPECRGLVKVISKDGGYVGGKLDEIKLAETLAKLDELKALAKAAPSPGGLVISGWVAVAGILALAIVAIATIYGVYQKYYGKSRNYTLVVKAGDV